VGEAASAKMVFACKTIFFSSSAHKLNRDSRGQKKFLGFDLWPRINWWGFRCQGPKTSDWFGFGSSMVVTSWRLVTADVGSLERKPDLDSGEG